MKRLLILLGVLVVAVAAFFFVGIPRVTPNATYGITFSREYARELGLDPDHALQVSLDDVGIRHFRIPAYWQFLEPKQGQWNFSDLDKDLGEIGKRNGKVILAIGEKLPRWPECWEPDWWKKRSRDDQQQATLDYIKKVIERYKNTPTIEAWQIENEPHFDYGDCPAQDLSFIKKEVSFARGLDASRPITTTDSGELSTWWTFDGTVDKLGVSVYRAVKSPLFGGFTLRYWFLPPWSYYRKALVAKLFGTKSVYVSEFQMEPWSNTDLPHTPIPDQLAFFSVQNMRDNFWYAERMGFQNVDFWGVEWWIWMKEKMNHPEFLDEATKFWKEKAR